MNLTVNARAFGAYATAHTYAFRSFWRAKCKAIDRLEINLRDDETRSQQCACQLASVRSSSGKLNPDSANFSYLIPYCKTNRGPVCVNERKGAERIKVGWSKMANTLLD